MRDFGKVFCQIWESDDFRSLSEDGRTLVLYLLTCKHATIAGVFRLPDGYACEDLQWTAERVREGFANVSAKGFATRCEATKWVWLTKFLEWNPPENPNQKKAAAKVAATVPNQCAWASDFLSAAADVLDVEPVDNEGEKAKGSGTVGKPSLNQKQKKEQKKEQKSSPPNGFEAFWDAYPKKVSKADALKAFTKLNPSQDLLQTMLLALAEQKVGVQWMKDGGQFIPNPATWLNGARWTDEASRGQQQGGLNLVGAV